MTTIVSTDRHLPDAYIVMREPEFRRLLTALKNTADWTEDFDGCEVANYAEGLDGKDKTAVFERGYDRISLCVMKLDFRFSAWTVVVLGGVRGIVFMGDSRVVVEERRPLE